MDIFDGDNLTPPTFYAAPFLADVKAALSQRGVAIHNLHSGGPALDASLHAAAEAYTAAFGPRACCLVPTLGRTTPAAEELDEKCEPQNTILAAAADPSAFATLDALLEAANRERAAHGLLFDAAVRLQQLDVYE